MKRDVVEYGHRRIRRVVTVGRNAGRVVKVERRRDVLATLHGAVCEDDPLNFLPRREGVAIDVERGVAVDHFHAVDDTSPHAVLERDRASPLNTGCQSRVVINPGERAAENRDVGGGIASAVPVEAENVAIASQS